MAIFSLQDAICVHCTIISYLKIYSNQRQQGKFNGFVDLNFIAGILWMAYYKNMPCLCFPFFESQSTSNQMLIIFVLRQKSVMPTIYIIQKNFIYQLGIILTITYGQLILNLHQWHKENAKHLELLKIDTKTSVS